MDLDAFPCGHYFVRYWERIPTKNEKRNHKMNLLLKVVIFISALVAAEAAYAGGYPGLVVERIWVLDGKVVVKFSPTQSNSTSIQSVHYAYTENFGDYKNVLALLLSAKAAGNTVNVYTGPGGTSFKNLIQEETDDVWSVTIKTIAIE
jgi:hypothetical protein